MKSGWLNLSVLVALGLARLWTQESESEPLRLLDASNNLLASSAASLTAGYFAETGGYASHSWLSKEDEFIVHSYDMDGLLVSSREFDSEGVELRVTRYYYENKVTIRTEMLDVKEKDLVSTQYDSLGRQTSVVKSGNGVEMERVDFEYDEDGLLIEKSIRIPRTPSIVIRYSYDQDKSLAEERWTSNDTIQKIVLFDSGLIVETQFYDNGILFAKDIFEQGVRRRQELWRNGSLLRTRTF